MLDLARELLRWCAQDRDFAVATVWAVTGSGPSTPGCSMAVDGDGAVIGTVSTACVEASVYELCRQALADGRTVRARFGDVDDDPFAVGPVCGGTIEVLVSPVFATGPERAVFREAYERAVRGEAVSLVLGAEEDGGVLMVLPDGGYRGALPGRTEAGPWIAGEASRLLALGVAGPITGPAPDGGRPLSAFADVAVAPPRLLVFGSGSPAPELVRAGAMLGYRTTICDARPVFTTAERFPEAHEVVVDWPHRYLARTATDARTAVCVLTHDARFEIPLLTAALRMPLGYLGVMGSRATHRNRLAALREAGVPEPLLDRLRAPIGLDLGGRSPAETALSILAEVVAVRWGGTGTALSTLRGALHRAPSTELSTEVRDLALTGAR